MKRILPLLLLAAVWAPNPALANRAPPPPPPPEKKGPSFVIEVDDNVKEAKLIIPKSMMPEDKAPKKTGWLATPTIVVAICLSTAFVTGGLWVARRGKGGVSKTTLGVILAFTMLAAAGTAWADLGVPPKDRGGPRPVPPPMGDLQVQVEVVENGDKIRLVVNQKQHRQMMGRPEPKGVLPPSTLPKDKPE